MTFLWLFLIALAALAVWRSLVPSRTPDSDAPRAPSSPEAKPRPPSVRHY